MAVVEAEGKEKFDELLSLQRVVNEKIAAQQYDDALKAAHEGVTASESTGNAQKAGALLILSAVQLHAALTADAMEGAKAAKALFHDALDDAGEGAACALLSSIHKENMNTENPDQHKTALEGAVKSSREAIRLMKNAGNVPKASLATANSVQAYTALCRYDFKAAVTCGKAAVDLYTELEDEAGAMEAMVLLADAHVLAAHFEDGERQARYLPQSSGHSSAAGAWAEKGLALCERHGWVEGAERCNFVLSMGRVISARSSRATGFEYETWLAQPTCK